MDLIWHPHSDITWAEYLKINSQLKYSYPNERWEITTALPERVFTTVASYESLARNDIISFYTRSEKLSSGTLAWQFLEENKNHSIYGLDNFNYNFGMLVAKLNLQSKTTLTLFNKFNFLYTSDFEAIEKFHKARKAIYQRKQIWFAKRLLIECESEKALQCLSNLYLGMIHLYFVDKFGSSIDLAEAKSNFMKSGNLAKSELDIEIQKRLQDTYDLNHNRVWARQQFPEFDDLTAFAFLQATIANYALLGEKNVDDKLRNQILKENIRILEEIENQNYPEVIYHRAKYLALLNENQSILGEFEKLLDLGKNYALKLFIDPVFKKYQEYLTNLIQKRNAKLQSEVSQQIATSRKIFIEKDTQFNKSWTDEFKKQFTYEMIDKSLEKSFINLMNADRYFLANTYWDYLDAKKLCHEIIDKLTKLEIPGIKKQKAKHTFHNWFVWISCFGGILTIIVNLLQILSVVSSFLLFMVIATTTGGLAWIFSKFHSPSPDTNKNKFQRTKWLDRENPKQTPSYKTETEELFRQLSEENEVLGNKLAGSYNNISTNESLSKTSNNLNLDNETILGDQNDLSTDINKYEINSYHKYQLKTVYPLVFFETLPIKIQKGDSERFSVIALALDEFKHINCIGFWVPEELNRDFGISMLTELRERNLNDILIASVSENNILQKILKEGYPRTHIIKFNAYQTYHIIQSFKSIEYQDLYPKLKDIYLSKNQAIAHKKLRSMLHEWNCQDSNLRQKMQEIWEASLPIFDYHITIRESILGNSIIELFHITMNDLLNSVDIFFDEQEALHSIALAIKNTEWVASVRGSELQEFRYQLSILFGARMPGGDQKRN